MLKLIDNNIFFTDIISGNYQTNPSINSQTFVEKEAESTVLPFVTINTTDGDYYVEGPLYKKGVISSNFGLNSVYIDNSIFDKREQSPSLIFSFQNASEVNTGILGDVPAELSSRVGSSLNSFDFYLNGQKIYSGESYLITGSNNGFEYLENITGKLFGIIKDSGIISPTGANMDYFGQKFIEQNNILFVNGMRQPKDLWLETNTGVNMIETGISSKISITDISFQNIYL